MIEYVLILLMVVCTVSAQLLIKKGAIALETKRGIKALARSFFNKFLMTGAIVILIAPLFYLSALSRMELSVAFAFTGLNYVFVLIGASALFKERVNTYHYIGITSIFIGIMIYNL